MRQPKTLVQRSQSGNTMKFTLLTLLSSAAIAGSGWSQDPNADNTGKNTRDRDDQSKTATDQSNDPADIKITADIRKMVVLFL
jgi:hypothetical protein